jgi:hypothetical protein
VIEYDEVTNGFERFCLDLIEAGSYVGAEVDAQVESTIDESDPMAEEVVQKVYARVVFADEAVEDVHAWPPSGLAPYLGSGSRIMAVNTISSSLREMMNRRMGAAGGDAPVSG